MGKTLNASDPDEENPEWTAETFARARPVTDFPDIVAVLQTHGKLGRPPLAPAERKQRVTLHLDPDLLTALKADGKGWQTRANAALRRALGLSPP
ncbi:MAG: BrnA antitoxin family protein [Pseudomonadota bacterium]